MTPIPPELKQADREALKHLMKPWRSLGSGTRSPYDHGITRATLRRLAVLGLADIRSVTYHNWTPVGADQMRSRGPDTPDRPSGPYVEARLTDQGLDVRQSIRLQEIRLP